MKSVKNLSLGGTHVIGCKGVRHLIGCRRPLVEKTHLWIGVALDESQKSAHKCREVYTLKVLRQMGVWQLLYQFNIFQICIWWKLQTSVDLYICDFLLHIFKTRNNCVLITNMITNLIFICEFFLKLFFYLHGLKHICVCIEHAFFEHLFLSVCIYPLWDCSGSIVHCLFGVKQTIVQCSVL